MRLKSSPQLSRDKDGEAGPGDLKPKGKDPFDSCYLQRDYIQKKF